MSKVSFRARALDATKLLPIFHATDIPDISDYSVINRTVPQMPTGMEKEEETEWHLQEVLSQPVNKKSQAYIPTPEASIAVPHYGNIYGKLFEKPLLFIRVPGLGLEEEIPDYDLDEEDEEWLSAQTKERPLSPTHFERMMDRLEKGSGNTVLSVRDAQLLLKDDEDLVLAVYDYWLAKRLRLGRALIPTVKHERRDGTASNSPYLAFRKRTEKMQTRKNRKNDEQAYMQMLKLKRDLARVSPLMELVKERENKKMQLSQAQLDIFKKRFVLEDWSGSIMSSLRPVSTKSATSRQSSVTADQWDGRNVLIRMEGLQDDDIHQVGRHEVLVSSGLKKKRKKKYYYAMTPEPEPVVAVSPEKPIKESIKDVSAEKSDDEEPDGIFTFKRKAHVRYYGARSRLGAWPWYNMDADEGEEGVSGGEGGVSQKKYRFSKATFSERFIGRARRRRGRGGRVMWDRIAFSDSEDEAPPPSQVGGASLDASQGSTEDENTVKSLHFFSRSPSPSSKFEFQHFPLIEHPSSEGAPYQPHGAANIPFGGFASDSEFQDEASCFSTLPTSQFALKPSSSDVECDTGDWGSDSMDWNWTDSGHPSHSEGSTNSQETHQQNFKRTTPITTNVDHSPTADKPLPLSSRLSSANEPAVPRHAAPQQQQQVEQQPQSADKSRTSLSVTDSKTIVLSNNSSSSSAESQPQTKSGSSGVLKPSQAPPAPRSTAVAEATTAVSEKKNRDKFPPNGPTIEPTAAATTAKAEKEKTTVDAWSMNGPATVIKQLNFPPRSPKENAGTGRKCLFATVDAALLITSQFQLKRDENVVSLPAQPPMAIVAGGSPQPKIANVSRDIHSGSLNPAVKVDPLPPGILQSGPLAPGGPPASNNPPLKIDSLPGVLEQRRISLPAIRRASATTNGNNYPEILHSATRRLSETERGLKQALAGSVNSLIETTANSLVPLSNSSEVT